MGENVPKMASSASGKRESVVSLESGICTATSNCIDKEQVAGLQAITTSTLPSISGIFSRSSSGTVRSSSSRSSRNTSISKSSSRSMAKMGNRHLSRTGYRLTSSLSAYNPPSRIPSRVLAEADYVKGLTHIIERDYYPDLHRLRLIQTLAQRQDSSKPLPDVQTLLAALPSPSLRHHTRDFCGSVLRQPSDGTASVRTTTRSTPLLLTTKHEMASIMSGGSSQARKRSSKETESGLVTYARNSQGKVIRIDKNIRLDQFTAKYTSEDNADFDQVLRKDLEKRRQRHTWMFKQQNNHNTTQAALLNPILKSLNGPQKDADDTTLMPPPPPRLPQPRPSTLQSNFHEARNPLMFLPDGYNPRTCAITATGTHVELGSSSDMGLSRNTGGTTTVRDALPMAAYNETNPEDNPCCALAVKILSHKRTRFTTQQQLDDKQLSAQILKRQRQIEQNKANTEGHEAVVSGAFQEDSSESLGGMVNVADGKTYDYVKTPTIIPGEGVDQSPLMTWGEVASTPVLLDQQLDDPGGNLPNSLSLSDYLNTCSSVDGPWTADQASGPSFQIAEPGARETAARVLQQRSSTNRQKSSTVLNLHRTAARKLAMKNQSL